MKLICKNLFILAKSGQLFSHQFRKIKITNPLQLKTSEGSKSINPGFQFKIDLVPENRDEIIIFEEKTGDILFSDFSLLQLYYPLIYLRSIIQKPKPTRTIFIDITTINNSETYRLLDIYFKDDMFDEVEVLAVWEY